MRCVGVPVKSRSRKCGNPNNRNRANPQQTIRIQEIILFAEGYNAHEYITTSRFLLQKSWLTCLERQMSFLP